MIFFQKNVICSYTILNRACNISEVAFKMPHF